MRSMFNSVGNLRGSRMEVLFIEYLIEEKLLSQEQLLEAIIEQLQSIPSVPELLFELNILSKADLLRILIHQKYESTEFLTSAKTLGLWSPQISQQVSKKLNSIHKPISEVLIQKGFLDLESITAAFVKYVEIQENKKVLEKEEKKDSPEYNLTILKEYIICFEATIFPNIQLYLNQFKENSNSKENLLHDIQIVLSEYVAARAAADFLGAMHSKKIANEVVLYIEKFLEPNTAINFTDTIDVIDLSSQILLSYCKCLKNNDSELRIDENTKNLIIKFWEKIGKKELGNENISR